MKRPHRINKWGPAIISWALYYGFRGTDAKGLRKEMKILEKDLNGVDIEKMELEKILAGYHYRHTLELGDLLLEILRHRQILYQSDNEKYEEAKRDEQQYRSKAEKNCKKKHHQLSTEDSKEIKKLFRTASFLCHPDKVDGKFKETAQSIFISLKKAYDANDLMKVREIVKNLKGGDYFKPKSETISETDLLKHEIAKMKVRIRILEKRIRKIRESAEYREIIGIKDWDAYFKARKNKLRAELEELRILINNMK